jgi:uncharacterized coiled-coil protein SlyX
MLDLISSINLEERLDRRISYLENKVKELEETLSALTEANTQQPDTIDERYPDSES